MWFYAWFWPFYCIFMWALKGSSHEVIVERKRIYRSCIRLMREYNNMWKYIKNFEMENVDFIYQTKYYLKCLSFECIGGLVYIVAFIIVFYVYFQVIIYVFLLKFNKKNTQFLILKRFTQFRLYDVKSLFFYIVVFTVSFYIFFSKKLSFICYI